MFRGLLGGIRAEIVTATVLSSTGVRVDVTNLQEEVEAAEPSSTLSLFTAPLDCTGTALSAPAGMGAGGRAGGGTSAIANDIIVNHDADVCHQVKILITSAFSRNGLQHSKEDDAGNKGNKTGQQRMESKQTIFSHKLSLHDT